MIHVIIHDSSLNGSSIGGVSGTALVWSVSLLEKPRTSEGYLPKQALTLLRMPTIPRHFWSHGARLGYGPTHGPTLKKACCHTCAVGETADKYRFFSKKRKGYSILPRYPQLEPLSQIQFNVIPRTLLREGKFLAL